MAALFPSDQLRIMPYNRVVSDLNGLSEAAFLGALRERFGGLSEDVPPSPETGGQARVFVGGRWYGLRWDGGSLPEDPVARLDVSVIQDRLLEPVLGIRDPRRDKRIAFVGGIRGTAELERLVRSGEAAVAISLYPVTVDEVMAIADRGSIMPPKSTWFEPKLRSGLLVSTF